MDRTTVEALLYFVLGACVLAAWVGEYRQRRIKNSGELFWPGTESAPWAAYFVAAAGALLITIAEANVEVRYEITDQQSVLPAISILALIGASIIEEVVFRGFTAPSHLTGPKLLGVIFVGSLIFALIHDFDLKSASGRSSTIFAFLTSVWLYLARFNPLNPSRSLLPCFIAHTVRNLAVFGIKWSEGFIS
ncbi:MAG: CPBP family intramembrane glutamic endopeptidase [Verrucomicrobiota bacterium]